MAIEEKDVKHVAHLARLKLAEDELHLYQDQLGRILDHMDELVKLDTADVTPTAHALGLTNVLRKDEPKAFEDRKSLLALAPESEGPYFKVPKVIE
jgi:aspartyl-tRNA(Asn)/glutamyl-tRNA(Gln) amidotransferase subunit C